MSDYDRIGKFIVDSGYQVKTTLDNLIRMVVTHYEGKMECQSTDNFDVDDCIEFVGLSGGLIEFDYYF